MFRHKVISALRDEALLSDERIELLLSWRNTGFSVHNTVIVEPEDPAGTERLARYMLRPPLSLERMSWDDSGTVLYRCKALIRYPMATTAFDAYHNRRDYEAALAIVDRIDLPDYFAIHYARAIAQAQLAQNPRSEGRQPPAPKMPRPTILA